ncbi:MAG: hypothetical protein JO352_03190 [Chloroflexi bacterium]|nr:hypothetical protein [Chloroflexota bacterium]MBV9599792.1 hypothetical protein [Chloroflexota bacterium]
MNHLQTSDEAADASRTAAPPTQASVHRQGRSRAPDEHSQTLYRVSLTSVDLQLIQAFSKWISRLDPAPDIRARLVHLEQQLARAQPAP